MAFLDRFRKKEVPSAPARPEPAPIEPPELDVPEACKSRDRILEEYAPKQTMFSDVPEIFPRPEEMRRVLYRGWVKNASEDADFVFESAIIDSRVLIEKRTAVLPGRTALAEMKLDDVKPELLSSLDRGTEMPMSVTFSDKFGRVLSKASASIMISESPEKEGSDEVPTEPETVPEPDTTEPAVPEPAPASAEPLDCIQPTDKRLSADTAMISPIDVFETEKGEVCLGSVMIYSKEPEHQTVSLSVEYAGKQIIMDRIDMYCNVNQKIRIMVPREELCEDSTRSETVRVKILDSDGKAVCLNSTSIKVRSKYDINMHKSDIRMCQIVNPNCTEVTDFIDRADGPLLKGTGLESVTGYQDPEKVVKQIECVFKALSSLGMHYVSDTWTQKADDGFFQRIRDPATVLNDRSGNCIEFTVLFCSILEAMDLEPVIVFPERHAVPGVVVRTNIYKSGSGDGIDCDRTVRFYDGGRYADVLLFESTLIQYEGCGFEYAVECAYKNVTDQLESIQNNGKFVLISNLRREDCNPEA